MRTEGGSKSVVSIAALPERTPTIRGGKAVSLPSPYGGVSGMGWCLGSGMGVEVVGLG